MSSDHSSTDYDLKSGVIGDRKKLDDIVQLAPYNAAWPSMFSLLASIVHQALGDRVLLLEHVGSTSVEGLMAKPIIDMVLSVENSRNEGSYVPDLEARGFKLRRREPEWFEHRLFRYLKPRANLHIFPDGCPEVNRMLLFRDRLRSNAEDRVLYEEVKKKLAAQTWTYVQDYADAKTDIVREILSKIE